MPEKLSVRKILDILNVVEFIGNDEQIISSLINADINNKSTNVLMWLNDKNLHKLDDISFGTIICSSVNQKQLKETCNYIVVDNPRAAFRMVLENFFVEKDPPVISEKASIAKDVTIGKNSGIGDFSVVEENCIIGSNVRIGHGTVIKKGTLIADNVTIGSNCTIGDKGLGYEKDTDGNWQHIPHIGNVVIHEFVSIHDNVVINKAVMGSTEIGAHSKIDSFVMIAHGVKLGKNNMVCGCASIAGSTIIGDNCWIAPNTTIMNKLTIGNNVFVGIGTVVIKSVADGKKIFGNPAKELNI
jgi:UDP-3-O-[3-hydroxymyristoyl] glucosamine N-acyltransferase